MRYPPQPGENEDQRHDAETRLYEPVQQPIPPEPVDPPTYATNVNVAPGGRRERSDRVLAALRMNAVLMWLFGLIEALIVIRFVLKAVAANATAPFTTFIYGITGPLVAPFVGVVASPVVGAAVFEFPALLAILIYILVSLLLTRLIHILFIDQPQLH